MNEERILKLEQQVSLLKDEIRQAYQLIRVLAVSVNGLDTWTDGCGLNSPDINYTELAEHIERLEVP